jgi:hypothetical protein
MALIGPIGKRWTSPVIPFEQVRRIQRIQHVSAQTSRFCKIYCTYLGSGVDIEWDELASAATALVCRERKSEYGTVHLSEGLRDWLPAAQCQFFRERVSPGLQLDTGSEKKKKKK